MNIALVALGFALLAAPFVAVFVIAGRLIGWRATCETFAATLGLIAAISLGVLLAGYGLTGEWPS